MSTNLFTSESVTEGHPDKVCDQISDAILDAILAQDPRSRVAIETFATSETVHLGGEVRTTANVDYEQVARETLSRIGYTSREVGLDAGTCEVIVSISPQSPDIAQGVDASASRDQGAGDQGMMFGYACKETPSLMPLPIELAHQVAHSLAHMRRDDPECGLRPDGKTQITIEYDGHAPVRVTDVLISAQHDEGVQYSDLREALLSGIVAPSLAATDVSHDGFTFHMNPTGRFVKGGPAADAGLTGRKIIVDTYGGMARHGGGAFSGKDPSKVDRSGAYAMRWVAKNVVAAGLADRCEVQVAYAIGRADPVSVRVDTFGTEQVLHADIEHAIHKVFDLRPAAIIADLDLLRPIYSPTAAYGHFGPRGYPWETTSRTDALLESI